MKKKSTKPKYVSREEVITALVTEPLEADQWVHRENCTVCAVGAILRTHYSDSQIPTKAMGLVGRNFAAYDSETKALSEKKYLGALSVFFEQMMEDSGFNTPTPEQRLRLVDFVMKHFPKKVRV